MIGLIGIIQDFKEFFDWRDALEIVVLSVTIFMLTSWLQRDTSRPLLGIFFGYWILLFTCNILQLSTLNTLLLSGGPLLAVLAIIFHQEILQQRIIAYKRRHNAVINAHSSWLELTIRSGLKAINQGKEWAIIIEHHHVLADLLSSEHIFNAPLTESLLQISMSSSFYKPTSFLWIKSSGILYALNAYWKIPNQEAWQDASIKNLPLWKQDALLMTLKTDAVICRASPETRSFDLILAGKIFEQIGATQLLALLKKHFNYHHLVIEEGQSYEIKSHTTHQEQHLS